MKTQGRGSLLTVQNGSSGGGVDVKIAATTNAGLLHALHATVNKEDPCDYQDTDTLGEKVGENAVKFTGSAIDGDDCQGASDELKKEGDEEGITVGELVDSLERSAIRDNNSGKSDDNSGKSDGGSAASTSKNGFGCNMEMKKVGEGGEFESNLGTVMLFLWRL